MPKTGASAEKRPDLRWFEEQGAGSGFRHGKTRRAWLAGKSKGGKAMCRAFDYDAYEPQETEIENEFLTPREVMNLLYIGKNTFYKLVNSGQLPAFRIGKLWRVRRADLLSFVGR